MKILAFTDLHSSKEKIKKLMKKIEKENPDIMISAGDTSNFGRGLKEIIEEIKKTGKSLLIIPGNHESQETIERISDNKKIIDLHKKTYEINNLIFVGYGIGGFSQREREFEDFSDKIVKTIKKDSKLILITHGPPYGTKVDLIPGLGHIGCISYINFIKKYKPILHICGHLHETWGTEDKLDKTLIINPGPEGKIIEV